MAEPPTRLQEPALSSNSLLAGSGHNLDDIYRRLRSFNPTTWFGKPPQLSALECAGKGWSNSGPDQLSCLSCGCQILCKLPINPWSDQAAGVVLQFAKRLVDAHSPHCPQRRQLLLGLPQQQQQTAPRSLSFPLLPTKKLSGAFYSRVQELQQLEAMPHVPASTRAHLAAAAASLDPSILTGLAAILQMPPTLLQREAAAALARQDTAAGSSLLSRDQAQTLIALCGWQLKLLLPPDMAPPAAADKPASIFGVSHLLPRRGESSAGPAPSAAASKPISSSCTALECELCGSQVGLWKYSCSGPFYAQQLSSKAMQALAAAAAASTAALPEDDTAADGGPTAPNTAAAAAAGTTQATDGSKPDSTSTPASTAQQKQGAEHASAEAPASAAAAAAAVASPEVVFSTLCHTIAGGSLLTAGASGGGSSGGIALGQPGTGLAAAGPSSGGPFGQQQQQQQPALQPFGSMPQPAFGSPAAGSLSAGKPPPHQQPSPATAGGSKLFGELTSVPSASVFGSPPPVASAAVAVGPFGGVAAASGASGGDQAAAAPVFGLQAFAAEEQRTKRRRSSAAAAEFAAAAAAAVAAHVAEGAGGSQGPGTPAAPGSTTGGGPSSSTASPAAAARTGPAAAGVLASGGGRVRRFSQQRSGLAAAVAAATGGLAAAEESCFDPVAAHRSWCPWVKAYSTAQQAGVELGSSAAAAAAAGSSGGLAAAVRLGWSSTVMAVQEALLEEELSKPLEQQQEAAGVDSMEGDGSSTAAVLARTRQAMDLLQSLD